MGWKQLGLFCAREAPIKQKAKVAVGKKFGKSKPIKREVPRKFASLAPGELDDPIDDIFPPKTDE
jgi:hypothetical protein